MSLSLRGRRTYDSVEPMSAWHGRYQSNAYHATHNPAGIINMGYAENYLCEDILHERLNRRDLHTFHTDSGHYYDFQGTHRFRSALARFLSAQFKAPEQLDPDKVIVTCGVGPALDFLMHAFTDPGDCVLTLAPYYYATRSDAGIRGCVTCHDIDIQSKDSEGRPSYKITDAVLEAGYAQAQKQGKHVKGIIFINPCNPTGDVYGEDTVHTVLNFAHRHDIHAIFDEIYGLSVFDTDVSFKSVLAMTSLPCPEKTHFMWGFSKDLALPGFHTGVIYSWNPELVQSIRRLLYMGTVPAPTQDCLTTLISDTDWLNTIYFPSNLGRMRSAYAYCCDGLHALGLNTHPSKSTYFIWTDFTEYIKSKDEEDRVFKELFSCGVFLCPGSLMYSSEPGWFRISFTLPQDAIKQGLSRIGNVLRNIKMKMNTDA